MYRSPQYILWIKAADQLFLMQKRSLGNQMLYGNFNCLLELVRPDNRRRDGDNYFKAVLDYGTRVGLIKDDCFCQKGTFAWTTGDGSPPHGCRLTIWDVE